MRPMADDGSPLFKDIRMSEAIMNDINEDSLPYVGLNSIDSPAQSETSMSSWSLFFLNQENELLPETMFIDHQPFLDCSSDLPQISMTPTIYTNSQQHYVHADYYSPIDSNYYCGLSLSFINPPEPTYHVRYLSEITNSPLDGNLVNTKKKTKKNISGRYLKGTHGRHVTIEFPIDLSDSSDYFIRVTRLTVPYQNMSFIHPYPLLYSPPKRKSHSDVIIKPYSMYYKLNKEEIRSRSKQFPNIILTRRKQCHLKQMDHLYLFDGNDTICCSFDGDSAKSKIANYQLKKSQLDFRLVRKCRKTGEFKDLNISCRSMELLEEEGTECRKSSVSPC